MGAEPEIGWNQAVWSGSNDCEGSAGRCADGQAEMRKDLGDYRGIFDGGDDCQGAATMWAVFHVDSEHPFEVRFVVLRRVRTRITTPTPPKGGLNFQLDTGENPVRETHT